MNLDDKQQLKLYKAKYSFYAIFSILGGIALLVVLSQALNILSIPVSVLIFTTIIVFCLRNVVSSLERHGVNRALGTTISYVVMVVILALIVFLLASPTVGLSEQFVNLAQSAPDYIQRVGQWFMDLYNRHSDILRNDTVKQFIDQSTVAISTAAQEFAKASASGAIAFSSGLASAFMAIAFSLVIAFWVLLELPSIGKECSRLISASRHKEEWQMFYVTCTRIMGGYIKATLLQCALIGFACGIVFFVIGLPNFAAIALITGIMNIIPVIGPFIGGAIAAIVGIFVSPFVGIAALLGAVLIQQFVYTFVSPALMKGSVEIHPALTLFCLLVGSALGGQMSGLVGSIIGMLIAIPSVALMKSFFVYFFEKRTGQQLAAEDGVFFQGKPFYFQTVTNNLKNNSDLDCQSGTHLPAFIKKRIRGTENKNSKGNENKNSKGNENKNSKGNEAFDDNKLTNADNKLSNDDSKLSTTDNKSITTDKASTTTNKSDK